MSTSRRPLLLALGGVTAIIVLALGVVAFTHSPNFANGSATSAANRTPTALALAKPTATIDLAAMSTAIAALLPNSGFEDGLTGWVTGRLRQYGVESGLADQGWTVNTDHSVAHGGAASAHIGPSNPDPKHGPEYAGFISTKVPADIFRGKRIRFSAYVRTKDEIGSGLWMDVPGTIDGKPTDPSSPLSWDRMVPKRELYETTDWRKLEIVLDVPQEADFLLFGLEVGYGQTWMDDVQLEVVGSGVPTTDRAGKKQLDNLDFEQGLNSWQKALDEAKTGQTNIGTGSEMAHSGKLGAYIRRSGGSLDSSVGLYYDLIYGGYYQNKKVKVSAYMNVAKAPKGATLLLWAYTIGGSSPPITQTTQVLLAPTGQKGWQNVEVTLDVPDKAASLLLGTYMTGDGEIWLDDVQLEVLGPAQTPIPGQ